MHRPALSLFVLLAVLGCACSAVGPARASSPVNPFTSSGQPVLFGTGYDVTSQVLGETRRVNVLVPTGYSEKEQQSTRYSVLYLLDGGADWQDFFHIAGLVHQGNTWGIHQPLIVVGVESKDRKAEFTWPSSDPAEQNDFPTHGKSEVFRRFLVEELKPAIDAAFRTNGTDAIMGESLAGLFVVETALRDGGHFDHYIAISPSLWWDRGSLSLRAPELLAKPASNPRTLWLAIADEGGTMQSGMDGLVTALEASGKGAFTWTYHPFPDEKHGTIYHPAATRAIRALFPSPPSGEAE